MKKLPNHIQAELKQLRAIKPEQDWLLRTKQSLLAELPFQEKARTSPVALGIASFRQMVSKLAWQPIGVMMLMIGIVAGPSIAAVNASKGSLPGDALYPVKRSLERARLNLTFSNTKRAKLEVDLVANRLHEIQRLTKEQAPSAARQQKINIAVEELKKDTATVKTRLDAVHQTSGSTAAPEAVALARIIDEKTSSYQETLEAAITDSGSALTDVITSVQDVTLGALDILAQPGAGEQTALTSEELKTRVEKQHTLVKNSALALQAQIVKLLDAEVVLEQEATDTNEADAVEDGESDHDTRDALLALQKRFGTEINPQLSYAEELIKLQDFQAALDTVNQVSKNLDSMSQELTAIQAEPAEKETQPTDVPPAQAAEPEAIEPTPAADGGEEGVVEESAGEDKVETAEVEKTS